MTRTELLAVAKPILFNTEMVKAILDNNKTVTRRVIKYKNNLDPNCTLDDFLGNDDPQILVSCSPYQKGDILYVRETWRLQNFGYDSTTKKYDGQELEYRADLSDIDDEMYGRRGGCMPCKWKPSIHMPKEATRIFLRVTDVRVERLQDTTEEQAKNEGVKGAPKPPVCSKNDNNVTYWDNMRYFGVGFQHVWNSTIKKADINAYGWNANPWVWVIEFERVEED